MLQSIVIRFCKEEEGQTLVEYGLLISLIALVVIATLTIMGSRLNQSYNAAATSIATTT